MFPSSPSDSVTPVSRPQSVCDFEAPQDVVESPWSIFATGIVETALTTSEHSYHSLLGLYVEGAISGRSLQNGAVLEGNRKGSLVCFV